MSNLPPGVNPNFASPMSAPPKKSNKTLWIVLGVVGGLLLLCCGVGVFATYAAYRVGTGMFSEVVTAGIEKSPEVKQEVGEVQSVTINYQKTGADGQGRQVFDVVGSKGSGEVHVNMSGGNTSAVEGIFRTSDGRELPMEFPPLGSTSMGGGNRNGSGMDDDGFGDLNSFPSDNNGNDVMLTPAN